MNPKVPPGSPWPLLRSKGHLTGSACRDPSRWLQAMNNGYRYHGYRAIHGVFIYVYHCLPWIVLTRDAWYDYCSIQCLTMQENSYLSSCLDMDATSTLLPAAYIGLLTTISIRRFKSWNFRMTSVDMILNFHEAVSAWWIVRIAGNLRHMSHLWAASEALLSWVAWVTGCVPFKKWQYLAMQRHGEVVLLCASKCYKKLSNFQSKSTSAKQKAMAWQFSFRSTRTWGPLGTLHNCS